MSTMIRFVGGKIIIICVNLDANNILQRRNDFLKNQINIHQPLDRSNYLTFQL